MQRVTPNLRILVLLICACIPTLVCAANPCEEEAQWVAAKSTRHFIVLTGRSGVFYERSGPTFVMLMKTHADESTIGALGIYADANRQPRFGPLPARVYEEFLREPRKTSDVMLRLEINGPQYERVLKLLELWDRRVREGALLYPEIALDNILLVKQATQELNRCTQALASYELDWGLDDAISENNIPLRIPFEYFKELRRLNGSRHVPDAAMPSALLAARDARP